MFLDRQGVLERVAWGAAAGCGVYLLTRFIYHRQAAALHRELQEAQSSLEHERVKRKADRVGRIRAEQELRAVKVELQRLQLQLQLQPAQQPAQLTSQEQQQQQQQQEQTQHWMGQQQDPSQPGTAVVPGDHLDHNANGAVAAAMGAGHLMAAAGASHPGDQELDAMGGEQQPPPRAFGGVSVAKKAAAEAAAALAAAGSSMPAFPFRPIGHLQSVFTERNGTPRQPQLVPAARSRLVLCANVPPACLEGMEQYSHCWVLYVFHANTDLAKYLSPGRSGLKAKIHVPRLNGGRMGVLATRSPHRPTPIGLSTAQIIGVEGGTLVLGGADIVDGSPVLDIKPYVPFCDCLSAARAPSWVQAEADDEPLAVREVVVGDTAKEALRRAWQARKAHSMYSSAEQYMDLVRQVLGRDIRSVHQRLNVRPTTVASTAASAKPSGEPGQPPLRQQRQQEPITEYGGDGSGSAAAGGRTGAYHVVLENIYISYDISPSGVVELYDAWVDPITTATC